MKCQNVCLYPIRACQHFLCREPCLANTTRSGLANCHHHEYVCKFAMAVGKLCDVCVSEFSATTMPYRKCGVWNATTAPPECSVIMYDVVSVYL